MHLFADKLISEDEFKSFVIPGGDIATHGQLSDQLVQIEDKIGAIDLKYLSHLKRFYNDYGYELGYEFVYSMMSLNKKTSKLPVNIMVDEVKYYKVGPHGLRIMMQLDHSDKIDITNFATITVNGKLITRTVDKNLLSSLGVGSVMNFVKNNLVALQLLADQELYNYDFCEIMIPVGG